MAAYNQLEELNNCSVSVLQANIANKMSQVFSSWRKKQLKPNAITSSASLWQFIP